jgi:hypothetical protein
MDRPFETLESAHEYVTLLHTHVAEAYGDIEGEVATALAQGETRRVDALRLVLYKLHQLDDQLKCSSRVLNDLRSLRRLLIDRATSRSSDGPHRSGDGVRRVR